MQMCCPQGGLAGQNARLQFATNANDVPCTISNIDSRKSFPSGHASSSAVTMVYRLPIPPFPLPTFLSSTHSCIGWLRAQVANSSVLHPSKSGALQKVHCSQHRSSFALHTPSIRFLCRDALCMLQQPSLASHD